MCRLGNKDQNVEGSGRVSAERDSHAGCSWQRIGHTQEVGRHTCFSLEAMGPKGVVTWVYQPLLKSSVFSHTHSTHPRVRSHGTLPSGSGRLPAWDEFCNELNKLTLSS